MHRVDDRRRAAIAFVTLGTVFAMGGDRSFPSTAAAQPSATNAEPTNLMAYFVSWHHTQRWHRPRSGIDWTESTRFAEVGGSAVQRFQLKPDGEMADYDTRHLAITMSNFDRESYYSDDPYGDGRGNCLKTETIVYIDRGSNSGVYQRPGSPSQPPLLELSMERGVVHRIRFNVPILLTTRRVTTERDGTSSDCHGKEESEYPPERGTIPWADHRIDLLPDATDNSSFSGKSAISNTGSQLTVRAYRMGKCAGPGPIAGDDPVIRNEKVDVRPVHREVEPNGSTDVEIKVTCDGVPIKDAKVEVMVKVMDKSGYHMHSARRARGKLNGKQLTPADSGPALWKPDIDVPTDEKGKATLKFEPTIHFPGRTDKKGNVIPPSDYWDAASKKGAYHIGIAGVYEVTAKPTRFPDSNGTGEITAKVKEELKALAKSKYLELSDETDTHKIDHRGTVATLEAFTKLALDFYFAQVAHNTALTNCKIDQKDLWAVHPVSFNDIALPWGGLFDVDDEPWQPSHQTHNKGEGGDFNRFGAGPHDLKMQLGKGKACNGGTYDIEIALQHLLLALGPKYGHWDCSDLQLASGCTTNDILPYPKMPHRLHLHVED